MRIRKVSQPTQIEPGTAQITDTYSTSTDDGYSCNYVNNAINNSIKVVTGSHTVNFSSTGWKHGNFTPAVISGYKLVAVQPKDIPYGDSNMIMYNVYDTGIVYWNAYVAFNGSGSAVHVNLIYVKNDFVS